MRNTRRLYILDLDNTTFDTYAFAHDVAEALAAEYGIDASQFTLDIPQYTVDGSLSYDLYRHATTITGASVDDIEHVIEQRLQSRNYVYPDVAQWLTELSPGDDVFVMTVGHPDTQELKFRHAPALRRIPRLITDRNKGTIVREALVQTPDGIEFSFAPGPYSEIILLDDSPDTHDQLATTTAVQNIHVARPKTKHSLKRVAHAHRIEHFGEL